MKQKQSKTAGQGYFIVGLHGLRGLTLVQPVICTKATLFMGIFVFFKFIFFFFSLLCVPWC